MRYYKAIISKDLFGDWVITFAWGGIGTRLGNYRHQVLSCLDEAKKIISDMDKLRVSRGYTLV